MKRWDDQSDGGSGQWAVNASMCQPPSLVFRIIQRENERPRRSTGHYNTMHVSLVNLTGPITGHL